MRLTGHVALITGGGSGLGSAAARRMADLGASVVLMDRNAASLETVAQEITAMGGDVKTYEGDISLEGDVDDAIAHAIVAYGHVDVLVANAAVQLHTRERPVHEEDVGVWDEILSTNARGTFLSCRAFLSHLLQRNGTGVIVVVSSVTAIVGMNPRNPAYTSSKGALIALARAIAAQYGPFGIRCNVLCPGILEQAPTIEEARLIDPEDWDRGLAESLRRIPLRRVGTFDEMANVVAFLASDESSYLTGAVIIADGGFTAV